MSRLGNFFRGGNKKEETFFYNNPCLECKSDIPEWWKYCMKCGTLQHTKTCNCGAAYHHKHSACVECSKTAVCEQCEDKCHPDNKFCPNCGTKMPQTETQNI